MEWDTTNRANSRQQILELAYDGAMSMAHLEVLSARVSSHLLDDARGAERFAIEAVVLR